MSNNHLSICCTTHTMSRCCSPLISIASTLSIEQGIAGKVTSNCQSKQKWGVNKASNIVLLIHLNHDNKQTWKFFNIKGSNICFEHSTSVVDQVESFKKYYENTHARHNLKHHIELTFRSQQIRNMNPGKSFNNKWEERWLHLCGRFPLLRYPPIASSP